VNRYGFVIASGNVKLGEATRIVQVFSSGEVWSIDAASLWGHDGRRNPLSAHYFESDIVEALAGYRRFLVEKLGIRPPFRWVAGVTGLEGRQLALPPPPQGKTWHKSVIGRCSNDALHSEGMIGLDDDPAKTLHDFFKDVWSYFGIDRAKALEGWRDRG
jgi:hypothetical protein